MTPSPEADLLYNFEAFGLSVHDVERVFRFARTVTRFHQPAALDDIACPYRIGVAVWEHRNYHNGEVLGRYGEWVFLAWRKDKRNLREEWLG